MDEHGLPTNFGGEGMAMSAEYSTEDGEEEEEFKVTIGAGISIFNFFY
jgi:hypothetical protein